MKIHEIDHTFILSNTFIFDFRSEETENTFTLTVLSPSTTKKILEKLLIRSTCLRNVLHYEMIDYTDGKIVFLSQDIL